MMPAGLLMLPTVAWACPTCPSDGRTRVAAGIVDTFWDTADDARPGDAIVARPLMTMTTPGPATTILRPDAGLAARAAVPAPRRGRRLAHHRGRLRGEARRDV